jgi:hypothetical protein
MDDADIIDRVLVSQRVWDEWFRRTSNVALSLMRQTELSPQCIEEERARPGPDGTLVIYVNVPVYGRLEMAVEPGQWKYAPGAAPVAVGG